MATTGTEGARLEAMRREVKRIRRLLADGKLDATDRIMAASAIRLAAEVRKLRHLFPVLILPLLALLIPVAGGAQGVEVTASGSRVNVVLERGFAPDARVVRAELQTARGSVLYGWTCGNPASTEGYGCHRLQHPNATEFSLPCPTEDGGPQTHSTYNAREGYYSGHVMYCVDASPLSVHVEVADTEAETEWAFVDGRSVRRLAKPVESWRTVFTGTVSCRDFPDSADGRRRRVECQVSPR